jgi:hypothetical protein
MRLFAPLVLVAALAVPSASVATDGPPAARRDDVRRALVVLHDWDERRARAWAASDARALRALYVSGSTAARSDVRLLRSYAARGFVVRRLVTQVFGVRVLRSAADLIVLRVLDRVAGGQVVDGDRVLALPSTRPVVRRIVLQRVGTTWKVARVTR